MTSVEDLKVGDYISFGGNLRGVVKCVKICNCTRGFNRAFCVERDDGSSGVGCNKLWALCGEGYNRNYRDLRILGKTNVNSKIIVKE